jgi:hypothetical protein
MVNQLIHFGKLSLLYEDGFIRYVRAGGIEIVRKIYFALRDESWATADIVRTDERISVTWRGFEISYTATNVVGTKEVFRWQVKISGNESGELEFLVDGEALAMYNRNRAGICVLHPIRETKERPVKVTRPDGTIYEDKFPSLINPHQPFFDIRKMNWQLNDKVWAELEFDGDVFETEDQRNWGDTSFKTYSTPLSIPFPVMLKPGDRVKQRVRMKLINGETLPAADITEDIEVTVDENYSASFPKIGVDFPGTIPSQKETELLKLLDFEHLRIELTLSSPSWRAKFKTGIETARMLGTKIFAHLIVDKPEEWDDFAEQSRIDSISKIAISPLDRKADVDKLVGSIFPKARKLFPGASVGAGFRSYFTELNRNRFDYSKVDFLIYPLTPQAHATDTHTIIENLPAQGDAIITANVFAPGKKIHTGLVSIKPPFNPDAKIGAATDPDAKFDERQRMPLAAGWALGTIKYLSEAGVDSITLFESHGPAGYLVGDKLFPVYNALLTVQRMKPKRVFKSWCNEPLVVTSLFLEDENGKRHLALINHTNSKKFVTVGETLYTLGDQEIQFISIK